MEQCVKIDGRKVRLKASAGVLVVYKSQFGADYISDVQDIKNYDDFLRAGFRLLWSMAKCADPDTPPPKDWFRQYKGFDFKKVLEKANELFAQSLDGIEGIEDGEPHKAERLIACAALCGISLSDMNELPISMVINAINEYCELRGGNGSGEAVKASQEDFDNF